MRIDLARKLVIAILLMFGLSSAPAMAQTLGSAVATSNVNVRQGPGTSFPVVDVLRQGESVTITRCNSNNWCLIERGRLSGWVSRQFLRNVIGASPGRPGPNIDLNINIGPGGISVGSGRACFYEQVNFRGRSFCARSGESDRSLGNWNNRISSIAVEGRRTRVEVCTDRNFQNCSTFDDDVPILNRMLQQNISSFRVR